MTQKSASSLQRTMIIYFVLIGVASLFVAVEFVIEMNGSDLKTDLMASFQAHSGNPQNQEIVLEPIVRLRNKAILMIGIILFVMIIVLTMFIKNITEPLQHMIEISKQISRGDLSRTVSVQADNELAELGNVINEMSSNLQEIILFSKNLCSYGNDFTSTASQLLNQDNLDQQDLEKLKNQVRQLQTELDMVGEVIEYFDFYTIES